MNEHQLGVWRGFRQLFDILPRRRRAQGIALIFLTLLGAFAELLTIGAVLPFLALIADPASAERIPFLSDFLAAVGADDQRGAVFAIALVFSVVAIGAAVIRIILTWASKAYTLRIGYDLSVLLYKKLLYQPYMFHMRNSSSLGISGILKAQAVATQVLWPLVTMFTAVVISTFILVVLVIISASVAVGAALAFGLVYLAVSLVTRKRLQRNSLILAQSSPFHLKALQEGFGGIRDVLIDQSQPVHVARFARLDNKMRGAHSANALIGALPRFVIEAMGMVMIAMLALMLNSGEGGLSTALPLLGALALGAQRLLPLLQQIYAGWAQLKGSSAIFADALDLLKLPLPNELERRRIDRMPFEQSISLEDLSFRYVADGPMVLRNVTITITKGSRSGFIGKTGGGKSTLIDIVMGLLKPSSGALRVDGQLIAGDNIPSWQQQVAHVPQHIFLSDGTITENIAFGLRPQDIEEERVREAARKADIAAFIEEQPNGYDTIVGERGVRLSGGQRQRIGIARALYKRSTVLILDEATNALDDATEASIMEAIDRLGRDITVLMIAHRLTTLRNCDVIHRLDSGQIVESGNYDEVIGDTFSLAAKALPLRSRTQ